MKSDQRGFTLIELLIYVAIFASIIGAVVGLALLASSQKVMSQNTADINYQGEAVMAMITQTVRRSTAISSPNPGNTSGTLTLAMASASVNPTVFGSVTDATTTRMRIGEGNPAIYNNLTNGRAVLSDLTFTNMSNPSTKGSVQIRFTLRYNTTSNRPELQFAKTFYGAATIP
jgi:prepilin-type N-terminal cleavage/methylation domain-containing protein